MADKSLVMNFLNEQGKKVSLRVDCVKDDLTQTQISDLMNVIISKNIFKTNGGDIKTRDSAQMTEKNVTNFEVR